MNKVVNKTVKLRLVGLGRNDFSLMTTFQRQAREEGWTYEEIDAVLTEAQRGDYAHLVATLATHCEWRGE